MVDERLTQADAEEIKREGEEDVNESNAMYDGMVADNNAMRDQTLDMIATNEASQKEIANANTEFTIDKIEQEKAQTQKDYIKEQSGAYKDWQKQSDPYGANAEAMASNGLTNTGYSESSQVAMYTAYQNRVAVARESYNQAVVDYNNAITEARLQNNSLLAEIAAQALEKRMEAIITFTQQGNALLIQKADAAHKIKQTAHSNWMDVLKTIAQQRQFDTSLAEQQRQFNEEMAYKQSNSGSGIIEKGDNQIDKDNSFTGTTYKEACDFIKSKGYDSSGVMDQAAWQRHKNNGDEYSQFSSYAEYLKYYVAYATSRSGGVGGNSNIVEVAMQ
jgi:hypothetical protein